MQIKMLKTMAGSEDGAVTRLFRAGEVYQLGQSARAVELAKVFLREGWAEEVVDAGADAPPVEAPPVPARRRKG